jgi:A/G-specific adenine glycosylase
MAPPTKSQVTHAEPRPGTLHQLLTHWYAEHARPLPWRASRDPWRVWVSEIMLQQTQVDTVVPRYAPFLRQFPTPDAMAAVPVEAVCEAWAGLGFYRRARALHAGACAVVQAHGGQVPRSLEALLALSGVGRYTAGAIASIAFDLPAPIVDGNVVRVLSRIYCLTATLETAPGRRTLWAHAEALVTAGPAQLSGALNQALMELGRTVCTPRAPACMLCPLQAVCRAKQTGTQHMHPVPVARKAPQPLAMVFAWRQDAAGLWLRQRDVHGKWAGLWEPPSAEGDEAANTLTAEGIGVGAPLWTVSHTLTHRQITAVVCQGEGDAEAWRRAGAKPVLRPLEAPLSTLARKAIVAASATMLGRAP